LSDCRIQDVGFDGLRSGLLWASRKKILGDTSALRYESYASKTPAEKAHFLEPIYRFDRYSNADSSRRTSSQIDGPCLAVDRQRRNLLSHLVTREGRSQESVWIPCRQRFVSHRLDVIERRSDPFNVLCSHLASGPRPDGPVLRAGLDPDPILNPLPGPQVLLGTVRAALRTPLGHKASRLRDPGAASNYAKRTR